MPRRSNLFAPGTAKQVSEPELMEVPLARPGEVIKVLRAGGVTRRLALQTSDRGAAAWVKSTSTWAVFQDGAWEVGVVMASRLMSGGVQVVGARARVIADVAGGATVDAQARAAIGEILTALRGHGLIATERLELKALPEDTGLR